ncbi:YncE family protein [Parafrankia sp. FMc6]|uniref:YVTN family beta-propeller repeat protein n=1 Tax=Parafrankia soli TaxID=2599596 RepID=UPI0034D3A9E1
MRRAAGSSSIPEEAVSTRRRDLRRLTGRSDSSRKKRLLALGVQAVVATLVLAGVPSRAEAARPGPAVKVFPRPMEAAIPGQAGGALPRPEGGGVGSTRVYVANWGASNVSVIDARSNNLVATIPHDDPEGIAATKKLGGRVYVAGTNGFGTEDYIDGLTVIDPRDNRTVGGVPLLPGQDAGAVKVAVTDRMSRPRAYVTGVSANIVSAIDLTTNEVVATIPVGAGPYGVAVADSLPRPRVYVANTDDNTVSAIDVVTNKVVATIPAGAGPYGVAVLDRPVHPRVYVTNLFDNTVSVIDATSNKVVATITLPAEDIGPSFLAIDDNPRAPRAYIPEQLSNNVTVLDLRTNTVIAEIPVGDSPNTVALDDDHRQPRAYTSNFWSGDVSVIDLKRGAVVATVPVGGNPLGVAVLKK